VKYYHGKMTITSSVKISMLESGQKFLKI